MGDYEALDLSSTCNVGIDDLETVEHILDARL